MQPESQDDQKKPGRPSDYSDALATLICDRIAEGESLRGICKDEGMPDKATVLRWLKKPENTAFRDQYAQAHEDQAETMAAEILEIADDGSNDFMTVTKGDASYVIENKEWTSRSKLRVEARFKLMALLAPKKYGTKHVDHTTGGEPFKAYAGFDPDQV
jgi:hypothetical protein